MVNKLLTGKQVTCILKTFAWGTTYLIRNKIIFAHLVKLNPYTLSKTIQACLVAFQNFFCNTPTITQYSTCTLPFTCIHAIQWLRLCVHCVYASTIHKCMSYHNTRKRIQDCMQALHAQDLSTSTVSSTNWWTKLVSLRSEGLIAIYSNCTSSLVKNHRRG